MKRGSVLVALLALASCGAPPPPESKEAGKAFDLIDFFTGPSHGEGNFTQIFKNDRRLVVDSLGKPEPNGALTLTQRIAVEGDNPRIRLWRLKQVAPGRYTGSLTDASGPVETVAVGRAIRIRYPMKGGLQVEQWLTALPGGQALDNRLTVTKWGIRVAALRERIEKR